MKAISLLVLISVLLFSNAKRPFSGECSYNRRGDTPTSKSTLKVNSDFGEAFLVRGHEGAVVKGTSHKNEQGRSNVVIKVRVDNDWFNFEVWAECVEWSEQNVTCYPYKSRSVYKQGAVTLELSPGSGQLTYEVFLNNTEVYNEVEVKVINPGGELCNAVAKFKDVICKVPKNFTPLNATNKYAFPYNSQVFFKCADDNSYMSYDGSYVQSFKSKCSVNRTWTNLHKAKCYTAPSNVRIEGNVSVNLWDQLNLTCTHDDMSPSAKLVLYKIDDRVVQVSDVNQPFIYEVSRDDDGKQVSCVVTNGIVEHVTESSQSPARKIEVSQYPSQITIGAGWKRKS